MSRPGISVGPARDAERYVATDETVWFAEVPALSAEEKLAGIPESGRFAAEVAGADEATYPGVYGVFPMQLTVPGPGAAVRQVAAAGLTFVGVHPDHRRTGVLTAMLRHHLEQVRDGGPHVSLLHASEPAIYGRYGYGLASLELDVTLSRGTTLTAPHLDAAATEVSTRLATASGPGVATRLRACHLACAHLGSVVGEAGYYQRATEDWPEELRDREAGRVLFARRDGADVGFAMFRRTAKWEKARAAGELSVYAVVGDPAARLALLRRLVDFDLTTTVTVSKVGADDPLLLWVGGPRAAVDLATYDSLWVRLVDLPGALADRVWSAPCEVVVEVADVAAPWNDGTWRISADASGAATVTRSDAAPEVRLPVAALGAAYLGGANLVAMRDAGLLAEERDGAVVELARALRTDVAPGAAFGF